MNYGPLIFLAAFFALATSWFGLVLTPQMQVGQSQQTNTMGVATTYPVTRPGQARQGLDVYRANGCAACHSQQIGQNGTLCDVVLAEAGTNQSALIDALLKLKPLTAEKPTGQPSVVPGLRNPPVAVREWDADRAKQFISKLPQAVLQSVSKDAAEVAIKALSVGGAKAQLWVVPQGPDIVRGWGKRRTVAEDFLYDNPVMLGSQRIGWRVE